MNNLPPAAIDFLRRYCQCKADGVYILTRGYAVEMENGLRVFDEDNDFECDVTWPKEIETNK